MGIHIIAKTVSKRVTEKGLGFEYKYIESKEWEGFDFIRRSGDKDLIFDSDIEWVYLYDDPEKPDYENSYRRPRSIDIAKNWVKENIVEKDQERLLDLFSAMEKNTKLWITISY